MDRAIGRLNSRVAAAAFGVSQGAVVARRRVLGIDAPPRPPPAPYPKPTPVQVRLLWLATDYSIHKATGVTMVTVGRWRLARRIRFDPGRWAELSRDIRTRPTAYVAQKFGLPAWVVNKLSHNRDIQWWRYDRLLGAAYDHVVAGLVGCDKKTVGKRRRSLGIPPFRQQPKEG